MEKKRTFSVNQRLMTLGVAALVGFGAMIGVGWYQNGETVRALLRGQKLRNEIETVQNLRVANVRMILAAMDALVDKGDRKVSAERIAIMSDALTSMKQNEALVADVAKVIGQPGVVDSFMADVASTETSLLTDLPKLIESSASDSEFNKIDDTIDDSGARLTKLFDLLSAEGKIAADKTVSNAQDLSNSALLMQIVLGLLSVGFMCVLFPIHSSAIRRGVYAIRDSLERMRSDDLDTAVEGRERGDEFGDMARAAESLRLAGLDRRAFAVNAARERDRNENDRSEREAAQHREEADVRFAVDSLADALARLADGDMTISLDRPFREDLERVRNDFNRATANLQGVIAEVKSNSGSIEANASQMRSAADDLARRTEQQAASLEQTSAALEEITSTVRRSSERAEEATRMVDGTKANAEQSSQVVSEAMTAMGRIETASNEIGKIINVIDEIAFQTNLLALNAGVEAARAGEAGKGFAVVAQEVRELAGRAAGAAKDIKTLIARSSSEVKIGVDLVAATRDALVDIASEVSRINEVVREISTSATEQSVGIQQINTAIGQMDQMTQQNAAMVEETNAASHTLASDAGSLTQLMKQFVVSGAAGRTAAFSNSSAPLSRPMSSAPAPRAASSYSPVKSATPTSRPKPSPAKNLVDKLAGAFNAKSSASAGSGSNANNWEEF